MNHAMLVLATMVVVLANGCTNVERSRSLADPAVRPAVTAMQVCATCHGVDGNAVSPNFPRLAGQPAGYLSAQLQNFRSHQRSDPEGFFYMYGMTRKLTDEQIKGLSEYFSTQVPTPNEGTADAQKIAQGREIYQKGIPAKEVAACMACHGAKGEGIASFPRLAYQHQSYLVAQLHVFQDTEGRPDTPMKQVTHLLSPQEMQAVAAFLQAFPADK